MLESYLRPVYQLYIVNPIAKKTSCSPMQLTYLACLSGIFAGLALSFHFYKLSILFLLFSGFLDTLDGTVARMENAASAVGTVADIISDRIVELAMLFGLFAIDPSYRTTAILVMIGSSYLCVTSFLVVGIFTSNHAQKSFEYSIGLIERFEAFLFFIAMVIWPQHFNFLAYVFSAFVLIATYRHVKNFSASMSEVAIGKQSIASI